MVLNTKQEFLLYINSFKLKIQNNTSLYCLDILFLCFLFPHTLKWQQFEDLYLFSYFLRLQKLETLLKSWVFYILTETIGDEVLLKIIIPGSTPLHITMHFHCSENFLYHLNTHTHTHFVRFSSLGEDCNLVNISKHCRVI